MDRKARQQEAAESLKLARRQLMRARDEMHHARAVLEDCDTEAARNALSDISESGSLWAFATMADTLALQAGRMASRLNPKKKRTP